MIPKKRRYHRTWKSGETSVKVLYRFGEEITKGMKYIVYKGECYFLQPKLIKMKLTPEEFESYMDNLSQAKEQQVINYINNNESNKILFEQLQHNIDYDQNGKGLFLVLRRKNSNAYLNLINSIDNYIKYISPVSKRKYNQHEYYVYTYEIKYTLKQNDSFTVGNNVSSLYTIVSSPKSILSFISYNKLISLPTEQEVHIHKRNITFLISHPVFCKFSEKYFEKHYYPQFKYLKNMQSESILTQGSISNKIIFIKSGVFELKAKMNLFELNEVIFYLQTMNQLDSKISGDLYDEFLLQQHKLITQHKISNENKKNNNINLRQVEFTIKRITTGEMIGCYIYTKNGKNIFTLNNISSSINTQPTEGSTALLGEFFVINYSDFHQMFVDNETELTQLNKYLNAKRNILIQELNKIKSTLFHNAESLNSYSLENINSTNKDKQIKKIIFKRNENKFYPPLTNTHNKSLQKTMLETKIFPLSQYHKQRKNEKPHYKFVNNFAKFLLKTLNSSKSIIEPSKKKSSPYLHFADLKSSFQKLNPNYTTIQNTSPNNSISPIKAFTFNENEDTEEDNDKHQVIPIPSTDRTHQVIKTMKIPCNVKKRKLNIITKEKQLIRMELLNRNNYVNHRNNLLFTPGSGSQLIKYTNNYLKGGLYKHKSQQKEWNPQQNSLPLLTTTQSKSTTSRNLSSCYNNNNNKNYNNSNGKIITDLNITFKYNQRNSHY